MLTISEVAKELKLSEMTIFRYLKSGKIKGVKIGKNWRVKQEEVERIKEEGV